MKGIGSCSSAPAGVEKPLGQRRIEDDVLDRGAILMNATDAYTCIQRIVTPR